MGVRIIDYPKPVAESFYQQSLQAMTNRLVESCAALAVYQVGGIGSPGISDLDMVVVFKDDVRFEQNMLDGLDENEKYLFIHNLYGISSGDFEEAERFAFYHQYKLLAGNDVRTHSRLSDSDLQTMKIQTALEFIVKMRITIFLQKEYGVIRLRDLLLHVKALGFDLDFLGITSGPVFDHVNRVIEWRKNWFGNTPSPSDILKWWNGFYEAFDHFFEETMKSHRFFLPKKEEYKIARNIQLIPTAQDVHLSRQGFLMPPVLSVIGKKFFRLQNRLNTFKFEIPVQSTGIPEILEKKFYFTGKMAAYNKKYLPHFYTLTSSLNI